jgi:hypothetical protein
MPRIDSPDLRLTRWLNQRGLRENPFAIWNAEREPDLSDYFIDVGQFDDLLRATDPCVVFAGRGCGKTAQRKMLAAQCRPVNRDSTHLAIDYTANDFERVLSEVNGDVSQVRATYHVDALLRSALTAFMKILEYSGSEHAAALANPEDRSRLAAYVVRFVPHLQPAWLAEMPAVLDSSNWLALLQGFAELIHHAGLEDSVVLVDGLDELPVISSDPTKTVAFLASLLGMLQLIECPGWAFKFFLPQELELSLRAQHWFRPDRLRIFPITWNTKDLSDLIKQRLTYFSQKRPPYKGLAQLCEDELAQVVNQDLVNLAGGLPRVTLILASMLLQRHCQQSDPPELIQLKSWEQVKAEWQVRHQDFLVRGRTSAVPHQALQSAMHVTLASIDVSVLEIDNGGVIRLGDIDITSEFNPKEYRVLVCLYQHRDGICTKNTLIQEAWPGDHREGVSDQSIAASVARLRGVLKKHSPNTDYIETVKTIGYRLYPQGLKGKN